jgi:hypothetical protein
MKTIKILTDFQHQGMSYFKDEVVKVTPDEARYFCSASWAKDETGEFPTGAPNAGVVTLEVQNLKLGQRATEPK